MAENCWDFFDCKKKACPQHGRIGISCREKVFTRSGFDSSGDETRYTFVL